MANIEQRAQVDIEVNSKSAQHKLAELGNKLDDLNKKKAAFEKAGDLKGMARMDTEIKKVERSMNRVQTNAQKAEAAMKKLSAASPKELRLVLKQLQNDLEHIERGSEAWNKHVAAIKRVKAEIKSVDAEFKEHQSIISRLNGTINNWGMSIASAVAAFTGLTMAGRQAVQAYAEMEAEMANVRKYTGMTAEEVEHLNEAFKGMDTRTSREDLNKLAQEAGRLGLQTEEDVLGFVKAADVINVALDDLGEGATLTLSKLTDIFGDKQALGVEQSLLSVGSVINELSQNCTASAPYLANFAQRLAGVGKQANMTIPQIMGFAAVLDSQGQAVEMSATALSQLIMKLFQDPAKIAKATGMEISKFNAVLKKDTNEALIMLLEQLNKLGDISVLAPVFESMGTDGARASGVLAALAGNVEMVKEQQLAANKAYKEGTSVTKEFAVQNNTVQAQLDKAKKGFQEMAVELGQKLAPAMKYAITGTSAFMRVLSMLITFISNHKAALVALVATIASYTVAVKASAIATKAHAAAQVIAKGATIAWTAVTQLAYAAVALLSGNVKKATMEMRIFAYVIHASPIGLLVAGITAAVASLALLVKSYGDNTRAATEAARKHREYIRSLTDVGDASNKFSQDELANLKALYTAATNEKLARDKRIEAVREMNTLYPSVFSNFSTEEIMAGKAQKAYEDLTNSIILNARARAAAEKITENEKAILDIEEENNRLRRQNKDLRDEANAASTKRREAQERDDRSRPINQDVMVIPSDVHELDRTIHENTQAIKGNVNTIHENNKKIGEIREANQFLQSQYNVTGSSSEKPTAQPKISYTRPESEKERKAREKAAKEAERERKKQETEAERERKEKERKDKAAAEEARRVRLQEYAEARDHAKLMAEMEYNNAGNEEAWQNQQLLNKKKFEAEKAYLEKVRDEYEKGTDERARAEKDLAKATKAEELRIAKEREEELMAWSLTYQAMSAKRRMELEMATIDKLVELEKMSTEEAEQAKAQIRAKYSSNIDQATGTTSGPNAGMAAAAAEMNSQMDALEANYKAGLMSEEEYQSRRWQIIKNYHDKVAGLIDGEGSEWASMVVNFQQALTSALEDLGSTWEEKLKSITDVTQAAFAIMGAGLQQYSAYSAAERDLEVAKVTESYDKQIEAAGKNSKRAQQLEKKKQADIAKIKSAYNKRAQTIEIAQAIASTAMAAINAYASAAKVPLVGHILGPIAAAMATAAGLAQVATIKKQHQAEAAGYYEGGFTPRDKNSRREVGVVHANEFVANHEAVANPNLAPVLRMIDEAQRNNTVGSLSAEDVSRAIGQGRILGQTVSAQQQLVAHGDQGLAVVAASVQEQTDAIARLQQAIDEGIEAYVVMDGERGLDKQYRRYQRLTQNPRR